MEFLKAFFGDKAITYDELVQAINAYNGDEKNKEKLIKMVNLTDGGYVSKDKYTNLETDLSGKTTELTKANNLIEELKKSAGKDEETKQKITAYETEIADLKKENAELKTENALKFALVAAGAVDVDYLVFKAKEKGEIKLGGWTYQQVIQSIQLFMPRFRKVHTFSCVTLPTLRICQLIGFGIRSVF